MNEAQPSRLDRPVDLDRDHVLGNPNAQLTLVEYGSYSCPFCHAAHDVIGELRDRFGQRMRYVFRHRPLTGIDDAAYAAALAEYAAETTGQFWPVHDALMKRGPVFTPRDFEEIMETHGLPPVDEAHASAWRKAERRVEEDARSARRSGALFTPTFFINNRRYEGPWDQSTLAEAMLGSLGHRIQTATLDFVRWGPSTGLLLLVMSLLAIAFANAPLGPAFAALWSAPLGVQVGDHAFELGLGEWINDALLAVFFLVVGLEIKRELTIGHLASRRAAMFPIAGSLGGIALPAALYWLLIPAGPLAHGWGVPIATDTAFSIAVIALLGDRVPVELRVFLTAAVIVDDLVAIGVVAFFYSGELEFQFLAASIAVTAGMVMLNSLGVYRPLPYAALGVALWICLHHAGVHATLAGVILAVLTPTRPPPNLRALMAQADTIMHNEIQYGADRVMRNGPSEPALRALDTIHDRIESPADKLLHSIQPWSSYVILPLFALANAGAVLSLDVIEAHYNLMLAIVAGLVVGKPAGILLAAALAAWFGLAVKPAAYSWRQLCGAGALAGIGFTMSLFIAGQAFPTEADFAAAKIAIFLASLIAGSLGVALLWARRAETEENPLPAGESASS